MGDFYQNGIITTLHNLSDRPVEQLESELLGFSRQRPMGLILPSLYSELEGEALEKVAKPDAPGQGILREAAERFRFSARGYNRVLRLARTLADLDGASGVRKIHVAEAIGFRRLMQ